MSDSGDGHSGNKGNQNISNSRSTKRHDFREGDRKQGVTCVSSTQMEQITGEVSEARDMNNSPSASFPRGLKENKGANDALSLVGQQAYSKKEAMEVNSPIKPITDQNEEKERKLEPTGQGIEKKIKAEAQWKRIAREKGKNKSPKSEAQPLSIRSKRVGKLVFEEETMLNNN